MAFLSIIIPFFNTSTNFINYLIQKCNLKSCPQYEVIWIDDGSFIDISNYVKTICKNNNWKFYRFNKNIGVSNARNKGIGLATADYIMFLDSDDAVNLDQLNGVFEYPRCDLVLFKDSIFIDDAIFETKELSVIDIRKPLCQLYNNNSYRLNLRSAWCKLLKKQIITENHLQFDIDLPFYEDAIFMCRYYQHCKSFIAFDNTLYYYRIYSSSSSKRFNKQYIEKYETYYLRFKKEFENNKYYIAGLEQDTFDKMLIDKVIRSIKHGHVFYCFVILKSLPVRESSIWVLSNRDKNDFSYKLARFIRRKIYLCAFLKIVWHQLLKSISIRIKRIKRTTTK